MAYRDVVLADSPLNYYEFETSTGTDSGSANRTLTKTGITTGVAGKVGNAWSFNGTSDYATIAALSSISTQFSIEAWVKAPSAQGMTGDYHTVLRRDGTDVVLLRIRGSNITGNVNPGQAEVYIDGTTLVSGSSNRVDDGNWHHIVYTQNGNAAKLYVDGSQVATATTSQSTFVFGTTGATTYIGRAPAGGEYFKGSMDEVALYTTALSATRVSDHYNGTSVAGGYTAQAMTASAAFPGGVGVAQHDVSVGAEPLTASAAMPGGRPARLSTITVTDDAYVSSSATSFNSGSSTQLIVDSNTYTAFIKLPTPTLDTGELVNGAELRLVPSGSLNTTLSIYAVNADWSEDTITYANSPSLTFLKSVSVSVSSLATGTVDLSDVLGSVPYGIAIKTNTTTDNTIYASEDNAGRALAVRYTIALAEPASVSIAADPLTATAQAQTATVSTTTGASFSAAPMTVGAVAPDPVVTVVAHASVEAESMDAYADMGDHGFAVPATATADVLTASATLVDATAGTTSGVAFAASPMTAQARWVPPALVNGVPIETNEAEDRYFQRVNALFPTRWFRLNDKGSVVKDRVTNTAYGSYVGAQMGQFNGPENRHSVHFDGNDYIDVNEGGLATDEKTANRPSATEFSFRTTKANTFLMIGQDTLTEALQDVAIPAVEVRLKGGKIAMRYWSFGFPGEITSEFTGFKNLADGEWHHVVIRETDRSAGAGNNTQGSGIEIWVDGKFEVRRYGRGGFTGSPDYIGGRPDAIEFGSSLPTLPGNEWFEGDMTEVIWYASTSLDKEIIPRNYYAFMGWTPVEATAMDAFAFTPAGHSGRGNQKRALALTWGIGEQDFYDRGPFVANNKPSTDPLLAFSQGVTDYEGYKVFGVNVFGAAQPYRDEVTDEFALINLEKDINLDNYDVIMFQDWPDEGPEIDAIEAAYPGQRERLINQLRAANDRGIGLFVTHPRLAVDLGIIDRVEWVPTLRENRYSNGQGNAQGLYDYGSAYKFPWNIAGSSGLVGAAGVGGTGTGVPANRDPAYLAGKAYYYGDTNKNDRFRVRALVEGLTDIPSYMIADAVFQVDYDLWGWQGIAYKYLHRMSGLQIGDEYIYHGSDFGMSGSWSDLFDYVSGRYNGTWATPLANVKAGTVVTTFGAKHWNGTAEVDNPYRDYATTIVLEPGDSLGGRAVGGKIYVNFTEQPNLQPQGVVTQVLPDGSNGVTWPGLYPPDTAEQREWEYSFTRSTLNSTAGNNTQAVSFVDPMGNVVTVNASAGSSANLAMVRSSQLFPLQGHPHFQMNRRGLLWLQDRPEVQPGSVTVRPEAATVSGAMPNPAVVAERDADVTAEPMRALGVMPKVAEDASGDVDVYTLPMTAAAAFTGYGKTISAAPMAATAEFVENFDAVHASGEQVVLTLHGFDVTLYIKEETK